jgi:hypothetical protein
VEVGAATREAFDQDIGEVPLEMPEVVGNEPLNEREGAIQPRQRLIGVNVWPGVVDDDADAPHRVLRNSSSPALPAKESNQVGQHSNAFN